MPDRYREELQEIASGDAPRLPVAACANPASYGWLRRPEYDTPDLEAWERPDGGLAGVPIRARKRQRPPRGPGGGARSRGRGRPPSG